MENTTLPSIKELIKDNTAKFEYVLNGHNLLIYSVNYNGKRYEFSIPTPELGEATVSRTEKAITLMRYIRKAINDGFLKAYPIEQASDIVLDENKIVSFSHYRNNIMYYSVCEGGKKYSFPVRKEDIEEDKFYDIESVELFQCIIDKAKVANEFHPC